jgi:hypothetical protein
MPNLSPNIQTKWALCKKLVDKGLQAVDKGVKISATQLVKIEDGWAELAKDRPIIIINNQNVNIQVINVLYEIRRHMDEIDVGVYREEVLKSANKKSPDENTGAP